jgi:hypothetical protein
MIHYLALSRLAHLDVKWTDHYMEGESFYLHAKSNPYYQLMIVTEGPLYLLVNEEKLTLKSGTVTCCYHGSNSGDGSRRLAAPLSSGCNSPPTHR